MRNRCPRSHFSIACLLSCLLLTGLLFTIPARAQVSISTGSIQGTVTDPSGAVVSNAKVELTGPATGLHRAAQSSSAGFYSFNDLTPGDYVVNIDATGFGRYQETLTVQVGNVANGNAKLSVSSSTRTALLPTPERAPSISPTSRGTASPPRRKWAARLDAQHTAAPSAASIPPLAPST